MRVTSEMSFVHFFLLFRSVWCCDPGRIFTLNKHVWKSLFFYNNCAWTWWESAGVEVEKEKKENQNDTDVWVNIIFRQSNGTISNSPCFRCFSSWAALHTPLYAIVTQLRWWINKYEMPVRGAINFYFFIFRLDFDRPMNMKIWCITSYSLTASFATSNAAFEFFLHSLFCFVQSFSIAATTINTIFGASHFEMSFCHTFDAINDTLTFFDGDPL